MTMREDAIELHILHTNSPTSYRKLHVGQTVLCTLYNNQQPATVHLLENQEQAKPNYTSMPPNESSAKGSGIPCRSGKKSSVAGKRRRKLKSKDITLPFFPAPRPDSVRQTNAVKTNAVKTNPTPWSQLAQANQHKKHRNEASSTSLQLALNQENAVTSSPEHTFKKIITHALNNHNPDALLDAGSVGRRNALDKNPQDASLYDSPIHVSHHDVREEYTIEDPVAAPDIVLVSLKEKYLSVLLPSLFFILFFVGCFISAIYACAEKQTVRIKTRQIQNKAHRQKLPL